MDWLVDTLQRLPELSIFLALAVGYSLGLLRIGSFGVGSVTGTLLTGVLLGQLHIPISASVKATTFLIFLFFVGYGVGPQFFRGLRRDGIQQMLFATLQCAISLVTGFAVAKAFGYDVGQAAGLLAGSQTVSALLGTAADAINRLAISGEEKRRLLDAMTVSYAVTYIFGTAGTAWILSALGPRLVGGNVAAACKEYESRMSADASDDDPEIIAAYRKVAERARKMTREGPPEMADDDPEPSSMRRRFFPEPPRAAVTLAAPRVERELRVQPATSAKGAVNVGTVIFVASGLTLGGLAGALAIRVGEVPLSLSTSGGALAIGLVFGWLRVSFRLFESVSESALATMSSVGLNVFIAVVGINAGPGFVEGLGEAGLSLFVAGIVVTAIPLVVGILLARYVFGFHPGIALGCVAGARTTAPALGAVQDVVQSTVPALGYTVPYAVGNALLTICGIAIVMLMS